MLGIVFFQTVSPSVYQNGIDVLFSVTILVVSILILIIFAKTISILFEFWQNTFNIDYEIYDKARLIGGLFVLLFAVSFNYITFLEQDLTIKIGYLGITFSIYGIAISILLSLMSDRKLDKKLVSH